jgi:hypothetical protein
MWYFQCAMSYHPASSRRLAPQYQEPQEGLDKYPFLRAGLEDARVVSQIVEDYLGGPRHAVCLMHDAIEFVLYEILLARSRDIYASGEHTIGLDKAISECGRIGIEIPLVGTVRSIQKHRGDAKHHAQTPHDAAYSKIVGEFRVVLSRLVHENFGDALGVRLGDVDLLQYDQALYQCHRKYRHHDDGRAASCGLAAVVQKHRGLSGLPLDYTVNPQSELHRLVTALDTALTLTDFTVVPVALRETLRSLPARFRNLVCAAEIASLADKAGQAYSMLDEVFPTLFDMKVAQIITARLVKPASFRFKGGMSWRKAHVGDTRLQDDPMAQIKVICKSTPQLVRSFGEPYYMEDDDRYWRWWEFAVFDGARWHSFHLDTSFDVSLECAAIEDQDGIPRDKVIEVVLREFELAAAHVQKTEADHGKS